MNVVLRDRDRGETLVEIVLAVVIIGVSVTALVSALATAANASVVQRDSVIADTTLRNMAESAKAAGHDCIEGKPIAPLARSRLEDDGAALEHQPVAVEPQCREAACRRCRIGRPPAEHDASGRGQRRRRRAGANRAGPPGVSNSGPRR